MISSPFLLRNTLSQFSPAPAAVGLATFLGAAEQGRLPVAAIDDLVRNVAAVPLTEKANLAPADLQRAAHLLRRLEGEAPDRSFYLERLESELRGPDASFVQRYLDERLRLNESSEPVYAALSQDARTALYILMARGGVPGEYLESFLANRAVLGVSGEHEQVLQLVLHLDNLRVSNIQSAFLPTVNDGKFIHGESGRVHGLVTELKHAFWFALNTDATEVAFDESIPVDWGQLRSEEIRFLKDRVHPHLDDHLREAYTTHKDTKTDIAVLRRTGGRLVEIKSNRSEDYCPNERTTAKNLLQVFRYALAVRRWKLQGIEYVIDAPDVSPRYLGVLTEALELTGVPYLLRVVNHRERVTRKGLDYPVLHRRPPVRKTRALPWPEVGTGASDSEPPRPSPSSKPRKISDRPERQELPWTDAIRHVLDSVWPRGENGTSAPAMSFKQRSAEEFVEQAQNVLRRPHRPELFANLKKVAEQAVDPRQREILEAELEDIRRIYAPQGETLSRDALKRLVRFADLASRPPAEDQSGGASVTLISFLRRFRRDVETNLSIHVGLWETELMDMRKALDEDPPTAAVDRQAYRDMLTEWTPDIPYLRQWSIREIVAALAADSSISVPPELRERLDASLALYDELLERLS